jgi:hypothetical protein
MQIFIKIPFHYCRHSDSYIEKRLKEEGWCDLTAAIDILDLTIDDLHDIYDFDSSEIKRFMSKRDAIVYSTNGCTMDIDKTTNLGDIKGELCLRLDLPLDDVRLSYNGRQLNENKSLKENGVTKESTLHLLVRLRGD